MCKMDKYKVFSSIKATGRKSMKIIWGVSFSYVVCQRILSDRTSLLSLPHYIIYIYIVSKNLIVYSVVPYTRINIKLNIFPL